jgi:hypothetical protein
MGSTDHLYTDRVLQLLAVNMSDVDDQDTDEDEATVLLKEENIGTEEEISCEYVIKKERIVTMNSFNRRKDKTTK